MIPTMVQFQTKAREILRAQVEWARAEFHLPTLNPKLILWDKETGPEGQARWKGQELKIKSFYYTRFPCIGMTEYASYKHSAEIGSFVTQDWALSLEGLIAHEMAHMVQFALRYSPNTHPLRMPGRAADNIFLKFGSYQKAHGDFFLRILREFRRKFVNHRILPGDTRLPKDDFDLTGHFEAKMAALPDCPYAGLEFNVGKHQLKVAGYNPTTTKKLFKYQAEDRRVPGKFYAVKLAMIINNCPAAKAMMEADAKLKREYDEHMGAVASKKLANARSRQTKARRGQMRSYNFSVAA